MAIVCTKCGLAIPSIKRKSIPMCRECKYFLAEQKNQAKYRAKSKKIGKDWQYAKGKVWEQSRYNEWLLMIKRVPKDYPRLTEEQWRQTVSYFNNKCAMCQENEVYARHYFVSIEDGGMYCNWNIIPVCVDCMQQANNNPFRAMNRDTQRESTGKANRRKYGKRKLRVILDYLTPLLLEAVRYGNSQQSHGTSNVSVNIL